MGRVEYGCKPIANDKWAPFISIEVKGKTITFTSDLELDNLDLGREFCVASHKVLSGPQDNFKYDKDGNA